MGVGQLIVEHHIGDQGGISGHEERVAVRVGLGHAVGSNRACLTGHVLHRHGLPERALQLLGNQACDDVEAPRSGNATTIVMGRSG